MPQGVGVQVPLLAPKTKRPARTGRPFCFWCVCNAETRSVSYLGGGLESRSEPGTRAERGGRVRPARSPSASARGAEGKSHSVSEPGPSPPSRPPMIRTLRATEPRPTKPELLVAVHDLGVSLRPPPSDAGILLRLQPRALRT